MTILRKHLEYYRTLSPLKFCLLATVESLLLSWVASFTLDLFIDVPFQSFAFMPPLQMFILIVIVAPLGETVALQAIPINVASRVKFGFWSQVALSATVFAVAHFAVHWTVGLIAGIPAGSYLAYTYTHWLRKSQWTAFWTTALSHALRNSIGFVAILIAMPAFQAERLQYDFSTNPTFGSIYYFFDSDEKFVFGIIDENITERMPFDIHPNRDFTSEFTLTYDSLTLRFDYRGADSTLNVNELDYPTNRYNLFYIVRSDTGWRIEPDSVAFDDSDQEQIRSTVAMKLESELRKRQAGRFRSDSEPVVPFDYAIVISDTTRYWTPDNGQVRGAAEAATEYLRAAAPELYAKLDRYCCQFWGITSGRDRRLNCNFFVCSEVEGDYWKTHAMIFDDGGDSFFQLEYDLKTSTCMNLMINGEA